MFSVFVLGINIYVIDISPVTQGSKRFTPVMPGRVRVRYIPFHLGQKELFPLSHQTVRVTLSSKTFSSVTKWYV